MGMVSFLQKVADFQIWDNILPDEQLLKVEMIQPNSLDVSENDHNTTEGDRMRRVPRGKFSKLGKYKLVPQLQSRHGRVIQTFI